MKSVDVAANWNPATTGFKGSTPGKGKADAAGANNAAKAQTALPTGIVAALSTFPSSDSRPEERHFD